MATGSGNSLGAALLALAADMGGTPVRKTYTAKGWHAQISKLTSTEAGYKAASQAGLDVTQRTLTDWLAERREPSAANRSLISKAYGLMAGRWPDWERSQFRIYGMVKQGDDERDRGVEGVSPLIIDGREADAGTWGDFRREWVSGISEDEVELLFVGVILDDIGGSQPWEFPGTYYTVTA